MVHLAKSLTNCPVGYRIVQALCKVRAHLAQTPYEFEAQAVVEAAKPPSVLSIVVTVDGQGRRRLCRSLVVRQNEEGIHRPRRPPCLPADDPQQIGRF